MRHLGFISTLLALFLFERETSALTLDSLLQKTIENNPQIQQARSNLERASGRRLVFRSVVLPDATLGAAGGIEGGHRAGVKPVQPFGFARGNIVQPFFDAAVPASLRRGDIEVLIAQQQLNVAVVEQLHSARTAYYTAVYNRSLKRLREEQRHRLEEITNNQTARYQSGLVDRNAVVSAEVQMRELEPRIEAAQRAYGGASLALADAMGDELGPVDVSPEPEAELRYIPALVKVDAATAANQRPDLQLARLLVKAANEDQRIIEAGYYPTIRGSVAGTYIPVSGIRRENVASPRRSDNVISSEIQESAAFTWRVVDNGKVGGAVLRQRSAREINELQLRKLETEVPRELARIQDDLAAIATKHAALTQASLAAEANATTVEQNLAGGVVSQLEFRLAQNAYLEIRSGLLALTYQQNLALAERDRAMGRYLQFSAETGQNVQ